MEKSGRISHNVQRKPVAAMPFLNSPGPSFACSGMIFAIIDYFAIITD
jgi:hypothetical protein